LPESPSMPTTERGQVDTITLAEFVERATDAAGGAGELSQRMGISGPALEAMSVSDSPLLRADATTLFEAFGIQHDSCW
jgi:hypothetical protein